MPKPPPTHLINHEELQKTEERMLKGPTSTAWKKIGVRKHFGICVPLFGLKSKDSCGVGEFLDLNPLGISHTSHLNKISLVSLSYNSRLQREDQIRRNTTIAFE